jgi:hypothetical protein
VTGAPQQLQAPTARPQGPETPTSAQQPLRARAAARQDYFPLTAAERTGINDRIAECLSIDPGARGEQDIVVELLVNMDADGTVRSVRPNGAIPTERRARLVYEAAQRAFVDPRCNPLPLPPGRREALRDMGFRISTRDLGLR